jgi:hypothetical protein
MKTTDFGTQITSSAIEENLKKQFNVNVDLEKYSREQLEDIRNKLRTRIFQQEGSAKINDLLTNEDYQKDKAMMQLLNTRIKEMLGEQMKKLRDKMDALNEGKKAKPDFLDMDKDGDKKEPMKKAVADKKTKTKMCPGCKKPINLCGCKSKDSKVKEEIKGRVVKGKRYGAQDTGNDLDRDDDAPETTSKNKKFDDSEIASAMGSRAPKYPTTGKVHKMKEGIKHAKDCDCNECSGMWESKGGIEEKWDGKMHTPASKKGMFKGKTKAELKSMLADLKKSGPHERGSKEDIKQKEINFALRAKSGWGSVTESQFKHNVRFVNESIAFLINEDEEGKAKAITAAGDMVNDFTSWMQRVGQYQTKSMIELADAIRADFGAAKAEAFKQAVGPALSTTLEVLTQQREAVSNAVATLAGGSAPAEPMGAEPDDMMGDMDAGLDSAAPDGMNPEPGADLGDEFSAADAAAGGPETAGRGLRESRQRARARKLAEAHSIMSKLAR